MLDACLLIPGGAIAQLGERLLCKQEVVGSIPSGSTNLRGWGRFGWWTRLQAAKVARQSLKADGVGSEKLVR